MKRTALALAATVLALGATALPAQASSMPKADFDRNTLGLGLGNGVSLSLDFPVNRDLSLGGSLSAPGFAAGNFDLRLLYKLIKGGRSNLTLALLAGVQAYGARFGTITSYQPMVGVGLAYPFTSQLTGRLNLVAGFGGAFGLTSLGPSGIELGYRFTPNLEGTIGANGRGDFLGLKFAF